MPRHMSNSQRIARLAAEAAATAREKEEKKKTAPAKKAATPRAPRGPKPPVRMKIVWAVGEPGGQAVKVYPYPQKPQADAEAARLGRGHIVKAMKVPMTDEEIR
jgi:hypothetical protein